MIAVSQSRGRRSSVSLVQSYSVGGQCKSMSRWSASSSYYVVFAFVLLARGFTL